ncbi:MAG: GNAT family N-acetyltransferase [Clostridia bacterium]|nr:GNAT family N-acetyltransferase [Clostridia bacterium]
MREENISEVYRLCKSNRRFYRYLGRVPTKESLTEVISEVPEGYSETSKYFLGFYDDESLIAIADIILGYPENDDAFIGWFLVDGVEQGKGIGSQIFADIRANLKALGYDYISLGCVKENEIAVKFWESQGFKATGEESASGKHTIAAYARDI